MEIELDLGTGGSVPQTLRYVELDLRPPGPIELDLRPPGTIELDLRPPGPVVLSPANLQARSAASYQKHTHKSHILEIPDTYAGSMEHIEREEWLYNVGEKKMWKDRIAIPMAMENLFKEVIDNPRDNAAESIAQGVVPGDIRIWMNRQRVTIKNGGMPIPIEMHPAEGVYVPEMIFGQLLTSSNYNKAKKRLGCGRNGYGVKLVNIFSTRFEIDIGDQSRGLRYQQVWEKNMDKRYDPIITPYTGASYVQVSYELDFPRFGMLFYPEEAFHLFACYAADASLNVKIPVYFNDIKVDVSQMKNYAKLCFGDEVETVIHSETGPEKVKGQLPLYELCFANTPDQAEVISFINGVRTRDGGGHVDAAYALASKAILDVINELRDSKSKSKKKKEETGVKTPKLTPGDIKPHLSIIILVWTEDPTFNSQTKTKAGALKFKITVPDRFIKSMLKWSLMDRLYAALEAKRFKVISKTDGKKKKHIKTKGEDANLAGTKDSEQCTLYAVEGKSALSYPTKLRSLHDNGRDTIGLLPLKGKLLDVMNATWEQIMNNEVIEEMKTMLGLEEGLDYRDQGNFSRLRYGHFIILTDADDDGKHILGLILCYFHCRFPSLLARGFIKYLMTPIVRIESKSGQMFKFYTVKQFEEWYALQDKDKYSLPDYLKGLGSSDDAGIKDDFLDPKVVIPYYDERAPAALKLAFHEKEADARKKWIEQFNGADIDPPSPTQFQPITDFINKVLIRFSMADNIRSIPAFEDGLKMSQRQMVYAVLEKTKTWGYARQIKKDKKMKVAQLATHIASKTKYHHGEVSMMGNIIHAAQRFTGSNNMPYFTEDSQTGGTRNMGGKDAADCRYTFTRPEWWLSYIFMKDDSPLLKQRVVEGNLVEFERMAPILPVQLFNGARGIGTAYSTFVPAHNPEDIVRWYRERLEGKEPEPILPWYRGFKGEVEIIERKTRYEGDEVNEEDERLSMVTRGCFTVTGNMIEITELPIQLWTRTYDNRLKEMLEEKMITDYSNHSKDFDARFKIKGFKEAPTHKNLGLVKSFGLTNIRFLMKTGYIRHFGTIQTFMEEWYQYRLPIYEQRRQYFIEKINEEIRDMELKKKCIALINDGIVAIRNRRKPELVAELEGHGIPEYITKGINVYHLSYDEIELLTRKIAKKVEERQVYENTTAKAMWLDDLKEFESAYRKHKM